MQAVYASIQSGNQKVEMIEKQMFHSIETLYELYIFQLSVLGELVHFETQRLEESKQKFFPTEEDLNPNLKFISNRIISKLTANNDFQRKLNDFHISWVGDYEIIHLIYDKIKESGMYKEYMNSGGSSFSEDKDFVSKMFRKFISESEALQSFFEEKNIFWSDDFYVASHMGLKTLNAMNESDSADKPLPTLFKVTPDGLNEDRDFVRDLFRKTLLNLDEYETLILKYVQNWEIDRIAMLDNILMKMAVTEILNFPSVPVKVSLNEYIDIAKEYSTPQSSTFINGILDSIVRDLRDDKKIVKRGRGLLE